MVRQNIVLPYLPQKWYGNCRACRTGGAAHVVLIFRKLQRIWSSQATRSVARPSVIDRRRVAGGRGLVLRAYGGCCCTERLLDCSQQHRLSSHLAASSHLAHHEHKVKSMKVRKKKNAPLKKRSEETQTLRASCSKAEPKIFAPPQTPFPGARDGQNLIS